jgi:very-short-patch-repair endonuclease
MSLNRKRKLAEIAKTICRDLRKNPTEAETILWKALRERRLLNKKFRRQHPIFYDLTGRESFFVADFYNFEEKLVVELDGVIHRYKLRKDKEKTEILNNLGLRVIRFTNEEVENNIDEVLRKISKE